MNTSRSPVGFILRALALATLPFGVAQAQTINPTLLITPQVSSVVVLPGDGMLVFTDATHVNGEAAGGGLRKLLDNGELEHAFNSPQDVYAAARDPVDGSFVLGGSFSQVSGSNGPQPRAGLARYSAGGQLLEWALQPHPGEEPLIGVSRLAFTSSGDLLFVGQVSPERRRLCVNAAGASVFRCSHDIAGSVTVFEAQSDGSVLLGGDILQLNGVPIPRLVRLLPGTLDLDTSFNYPDASSDLNAVAVQNGTVWVGAGSRLYRLMGDGSIDPSIDIQANASIRSVRTDGSDGLFVGGSFSTIGGVERPRLARLQTSGMAVVDPLWQPPAINGSVRDIAVLSDRVLAAGPLDSMPAQAAGLIALNRTNGETVVSSRPARLGLSAPNASLVSAPTADGGAVISGRFTQTRLGIVPGLLKVDSSGEEVAGWAPELSERVVALVGGPDGFVYAGFARDITPSLRDYSLRRLSIADGSLDENWRYPMPWGDHIPSALTIDSGYLWFGYRPDSASGNSSGIGRVSLGATAVPDAAWSYNLSFTGVAAKIIPLADGSALVLRGVLPPSGAIFFPPLPIPPGPRMYRFVPGEFGVSMQPFGPDLSGVLTDIVRQRDGRVLGLEIDYSGVSTLRRFSANGELELDFDLVLMYPRAAGSIALDDARGLLYFDAVVSTTFPSSTVRRQARLLLASQTVDDSWPNEGEDPGVRSNLTLIGSRLFAGAQSGSAWAPAGAFLSTTVQSMFADGFENP